MALQMHEAIDGIVIKAVDSGDKKRYLTVLTATMGRITLIANAGHSMHSHQMAVSQLYNYGNFEYYKKGTSKILKSGSVIEPFYGLSYEIDRMNLAAYLCELAWELTDEGEPAEEMLRLLLNALYAISNDLYPHEIIKGAFEWRVMAMSGYEPDLSGCHRCGSVEAETLYLDVMNGGVLCGECLHKGMNKPRQSGAYDDIREAEILCQITPAVLAALRYAMDAQPQRLFGFALADAEDLHLFAHAAETYLLSHIGHGFDTLTFYKSMRELQKGTKT